MDSRGSALGDCFERLRVGEGAVRGGTTITARKGSMRSHIYDDQTDSKRTSMTRRTRQGRKAKGEMDGDAYLEECGQRTA